MLNKEEYSVCGSCPQQAFTGLGSFAEVGQSFPFLNCHLCWQSIPTWLQSVGDLWTITKVLSL